MLHRRPFHSRLRQFVLAFAWAMAVPDFSGTIVR